MAQRPRSKTTGPAAYDGLARAALAARKTAYAPYSNFQVGAALLCDDGTVVPGCNVENASYGLCICAERTAVAAAVAGGRQRFAAIAIATSSSPPSPPCGMCRQVLTEFAPTLPIILVNPAGERSTTTLDAIFPATFTPALLRSGVGAGGTPPKKAAKKAAKKPTKASR